MSSREPPASTSRSISDDHEARLGVLVLELADVHRVALAHVGPQRTWHLRARLLAITALAAFRIVCVER